MDGKEWSAETWALCRKFARGRVTVQRGHWPEPAGFMERFYPRVAARNVRPDGMPHDGYRTVAEALAGGEAFRDACRAKIAEQSCPPHDRDAQDLQPQE